MLKSKDITLLTKICTVKAMVFPVVMYRSESWTIKEVRALKNWYFQTVMLEKTLETPLESKEIKPVNPKGYQPWILFGRTDAEAEAPTLWPLDENSWLTGKDPDAGKDWRQKRVTEDEMSGWHHWFNEHDLGQTPGDVRDSEVWYAAVYVVSKRWTWFGDWTTTTKTNSMGKDNLFSKWHCNDQLLVWKKDTPPSSPHSIYKNLTRNLSQA